MSLVTTKFTPPRRKAPQIERLRLVHRLGNSADGVITVVAAPAGYGKTSLLADLRTHLSSRGAHCGWLGLEAGDNRLDRFIGYFVGAIRSVCPNFGEAALALLDSAAAVPMSAITATLINELAHQRSDLYVFLDRFDFVADDRIEPFVQDLIEHAPPLFHLILGCRALPKVPLGRTRARGLATVFDAMDLRFTRDETREFLRRTLGSRVSDEVADGLWLRTEGWPAGLTLAAAAVKEEGSLDEQARHFSGAHKDIVAFLAEDVFGFQPESIKEFLLKTAVLDPLSPVLCTAVSGVSDSHGMLDRVERQNLFLFAENDDRTSFRYHRMFREFLLHVLDSDVPIDKRTQHQAACRWFVEHERTPEAIPHAVAAEDFVQAGELLNRCCKELFYRGQISILMDYVSSLPEQVLRRFPHVRLNQAWALILGWHFDAAKRLLVDIRRSLESPAEVKELGLSSAEVSELKDILTHRRIMLAFFADDAVVNRDLSRAWLAGDHRYDPYIQGTIEASLMDAERDRLNDTAIEHHTARAREFFHQAESRFGPIWLDCIVGSKRFSAGDMEGAENAFRHGLKNARELGEADTPLVATASLLLAQIDYERNLLPDAEQKIESYLAHAKSFGLVDQLIAGYLVAVRLWVAKGDGKMALAVLSDGAEVAKAKGFDRLGVNLAAERLRIFLNRAETRKAIDVAVEMNLRCPPRDVAPGVLRTGAEAVRALSWARFHGAVHDPEEAVKLLRRWERFLEQREFRLLATKFAIVHAKTLQMAGKTLAARRQLRKALAVAADSGVVRSFVDEGPLVHALLRAIDQQARQVGDPLGVYTSRLLAAVHGSPSDQDDGSDGAQILEVTGVPVSPLKKRQIEILQLVGTGLPNRDIATDLCLSESTVKWHMQQIFDKLDVRRRSEAVIRARQYGLIP